MTDTTATPIPTVQGLDLFEVYEASGALLLVASTLAEVDPQPGDYIIRRAWATAAQPILVKSFQGEAAS